MKRLFIGLMLAILLTIAAAAPALAHNVGHVDTPNGCVDVGGGNSPPEGKALGTAGHPRGIHHAIHAGQGNSAVTGGSC